MLLQSGTPLVHRTTSKRLQSVIEIELTPETVCGCVERFRLAENESCEHDNGFFDSVSLHMDERFGGIKNESLK